MNGSSRTFRFICITTFAFAFSGSATADEPFEVMLHQDDVVGAGDIEAGDFATGVRRLLERLSKKNQSNSARTPLIIDLCAGYTMLEDFEAATKYCNQAVEHGWSKGLALNNRGALNVAKGDYDAAIRDFDAAIDARGAGSIARRNLQRLETKVAAMTRPTESAVAYLMLDSD